MEGEKSKILMIGGTGYIGKYIVNASATARHPTFVFLRRSSTPAKSQLIDSFAAAGVTFLYGDIYDHDSLVNAIKQVDVVISAVGYAVIADQIRIISAIKEAGNVKRFLPSEFGTDLDHVNAVDPAKSAFARKAQIRRTIEAEGIPYTFVNCFFFYGYFVSLSQPGTRTPPRDKVVILGEGNKKAIFCEETDIATYTIRVVDDRKTLNKTLYMKLNGNILSMNELVSLWEEKIGKTVERVYVPEEQLLKNIQEASPPLNAILSISHSAYVKAIT